MAGIAGKNDRNIYLGRCLPGGRVADGTGAVVHLPNLRPQLHQRRHLQRSKCADWADVADFDYYAPLSRPALWQELVDILDYWAVLTWTDSAAM